MVLPHAVLCCISLKSYSILNIYLWLNAYCMLIQNLICLSSWVQLQLQNHPAELWEDGLKDYLTHASDIMVSFADSKWTCLIFFLCHLYKSCNKYFFGDMHNHVLHCCWLIMKFIKSILFCFWLRTYFSNRVCFYHRCWFQLGLQSFCIFSIYVSTLHRRLYPHILLGVC